jgi:hypothetical protein
VKASSRRGTRLSTGHIHDEAFTAVLDLAGDVTGIDVFDLGRDSS